MRVMRRRIDPIALVICAGFVVLALFYAAATPVFEAPDEGAHVLYVHNLLETGELPSLLDDRQAIFDSQSTQRHHPPLYYLVGALLISPTRRTDIDAYLHINPLSSIGTVRPHNANFYLHNWQVSDGDTAVAVVMLRLFSLTLATGTLWLVYGVGRLAFGRRVGLVAMLLTAAIPSFISISASVNNDNAVTFFYSAGLFWLVWTWTSRTLTIRGAIVLGLVLGAAALSKLTGLSLFGVVYAGLLFAAWRGWLNGRSVFVTIGLSLAIAALVAGWWYLRNWTLYGDPLALAATDRIWGRGPVPTDLDFILFEAKGVWDSFWMVLGQLTVRGPDWLYPLMGIVCGVSLIGLIRRWRTKPDSRPSIALLALVVLLLVAALIVTTRRVNVSQGRILFPALAAFAPLVAGGLLTLHRRLAVIAIGPLLLVAVMTPLLLLPRAFAPLQVVDSPPDDARILSMESNGLLIEGLVITHDTVSPGDTVQVMVYFSGMTPDDMRLSVVAIEPQSGQVYGGADVYPGMTFTSQLEDDTRYAAPIAFTIDELEMPTRPLRLNIGLNWSAQTAGGNWRVVDWVGSDGITQTGTFIAPIPITLIDHTYTAPAPAVVTNVVFGGALRLVGYTLSAPTATPGESLNLQLLWDDVSPLAADWTVAVGLIDFDAGQVYATADGMPPGYPTSAWRPAPAFPDNRTLALPPDMPPGDYWLYVGWYNPQNVTERLPVHGDSTRDNLYLLAQVTIGN